MMRQLGSHRNDRLSQAFPPSWQDNGSIAVEMAPNLTWPKGQALGMITASKKHALYVDANVDGTGIFECIAMFAGRSDANGQVFLGNSEISMTGLESAPDPTLECYFRGSFFVADLVGVDAAAILNVGGRLIMGGTVLWIP